MSDVYAKGRPTDLQWIQRAAEEIGFDFQTHRSKNHTLRRVPGTGGGGRRNFY